MVLSLLRVSVLTPGIVQLFVLLLLLVVGSLLDSTKIVPPEAVVAQVLTWHLGEFHQCRTQNKENRVAKIIDLLSTPKI